MIAFPTTTASSVQRFSRAGVPGVAALAALMALAAMGGCGYITPSSPNTAPPPVEGQALATWLEPLGTDGGHHFYFRNDSDRVYRITRIMITDCKNVRECGAHPVDVVLCPGETRRVFAAHPFEPDHPVERERIFFNWSYGSRSYEPGEPVVGADCVDRA